MQEDAERRVGTTLKDKWTLERLLGSGGMAAVYVGVHKIGRRDAIKILHPEIATSPDLRARFEQEAHAANRFKHPGAVEIRDIDVAEDGAPFLVMELLEGKSLSEYARERSGDVPYEEVLRFTDELLDVLAAAHAQGIIHRDVKLDNLFVTTEGRLKVLDFGIARVRGAKLMRTRPGATLGTTAYMPPEQAQGLDLDPRADLFAVGATMFRLLAKRRIHEAKTDMELLQKMAMEAAPPLASVAPNVAQGACLVVDRALGFSKEKRYPDALTMQTDVRALRAGASPPYACARLAAGDLPNESTARAMADAPTAAAPIPGRDQATRVEEKTRETPLMPVVSSGAPTRPRDFATQATALPAAAPMSGAVASQLAWIPAAPASAPRSEATKRSEAAPMTSGPVSAAQSAPVPVVEAPPLPPPPPPRAESKIIPLVLIGGFFVLVGVGVELLLSRRSTSDSTPPATSTNFIEGPVNHAHPPIPQAKSLRPSLPTIAPQHEPVSPGPVPSAAPHAPFPGPGPGPGPGKH